jgi:hypothetical protein
MTFISSKSGLSVVDEPVYKSDLGAYKVYTAMLTQVGISAPTADVILQNTIGNIVWTYAGVGQYIGTLAGAFTVGKTFMLTGNRQPGAIITTTTAFDPDTVYVNTFNASTPANGKLLLTPIEIRVYN